MQFRPTLWPTLVVLPVLAVLIGLGVWQLQRRDWKEALIVVRAERVVSPIIDLVPRTRIETITDPGRFEIRLPPASGVATIESDAASYEYRPVRLAGILQHEKAMHVVGRTLNGRAGEHVVTPLALAQGGIVLVDRGWVPPRGSSAGARDYARPEGRVVVEGYVRLFTAPGTFTPDNEPHSDTWFWFDHEAMARASGEDIASGFYVQAAPAAAANSPPVGSAPEIALNNPHLQYALTWFGVAMALVGVYVAFHIRRRDSDL